MPPNRQLDPGQPVLIYGAGQFARAVAGALQQLGVPVAGFVVTTPEVPTLMDCPVWSWSSQADGVAAFLAGILSRSRPVAAVAVYHHAHDLIEIPLALERIFGPQGYRYHLRQHQFNSFDCVLYAVPQP